ncbi:NADP-dependent oxidoreductase [Actinoplanes sp. TBRC 11911]|uniref:NADP-dependent oxidoreductase n=1 Tax=Actinoplanes sp. TBRC 11911 TaxID=2729386 RepID=UPI00145C945E|nr:NADP-dependent oxidoreductase [Actinoplanes sp. TBRC 11911]NMO51083.1 NADP-dependent oxidoreductase [Actinoplanes sp. TBRC 11911]
MRAAVFDRFGPPDVLRIADLPDPEPAPGEVRVRVRAAGVQPFDVGVRRGTMPWIKVGFPQALGQEYSGVVDRLGESAVATGLRVGDEVLGSTMLNGHASMVCVPAENVVRKPDRLDFPTAAGLVAAAQTASGALLELGVGEGDVLLVHAAAGSVGTVAVQLARLAGATVIGTASPANHDYLRQLGAIPVAYGEGLVEAMPRVPTVALDAVGGMAIAQSVKLGIAPERIGTIVDDKTAAEYGTRVVRAGRSPHRLAEVVALAAKGAVTMPIRAYPLSQVGAAHAAVESTHGRGKVVLIVEP